MSEPRGILGNSSKHTSREPLTYTYKPALKIC